MRITASKPPRTANTQSGFILLTVLWAIALISLLAIVSTYTFRIQTRTISQADIQAQNQSLADGFAQILSEQIGVTRKFEFDGLALQSGWPLVCGYRDHSIVMTATDSSGLVDINSSPRVFLNTVLNSAGVTGTELDRLMGAINDYRDPDDITNDGQNENLIYAKQGTIHLPKNSPFENIGELDQVAGMTASIYSRVRPYLTVNSRKPVVTLAGTPPMLAAIIEGKSISSEQLATSALALSRQARNVADLYQLANINRTYEVRVMVMHASGANFVRGTAGVVSPGTPTGFKTINWNTETPRQVERLLAKMEDFPPCFK